MDESVQIQITYRKLIFASWIMDYDSRGQLTSIKSYTISPTTLAQLSSFNMLSMVLKDYLELGIIFSLTWYSMKQTILIKFLFLSYDVFGLLLILEKQTLTYCSVSEPTISKVALYFPIWSTCCSKQTHLSSLQLVFSHSSYRVNQHCHRD